MPKKKKEDTVLEETVQNETVDSKLTEDEERIGSSDIEAAPETDVDDTEDASVNPDETFETSDTHEDTTSNGSTHIEVTDYENDKEAESFAAPTVKSRREVIQEKLQKETERSERQKNRVANFAFWEQLKNAQFEKRILVGKVIGVDTISDMNVAVVLINEFRVLIPYAELYETEPVDTSTVRSAGERSKRELQMMRRLLNAEIPFIIKSMTGNPTRTSITTNHAIVGSRKDAIARIAAINFNKRRHNGKARINEGDIVDASIISVGWHGVYVNVHGKDVSVPQYKLTYKYIENCQDKYKTGDTIKVCIESIEYDKYGVATKVEVSGKAAEEIDYILKVKNLKEEMVCMGRVTSVQRDKTNPNKLRTWLFLEGWDVPAIVDHIRLDVYVKPIQQGDRIVFRVKWIDEDNGLVRGNIISKA